VAVRGQRQGGGSPLGVGEDECSPWGVVHGGGGSSGEDRRWEAIPVVASGDLGAIEGRGGGAELTVVNPQAVDGRSWWSLARRPRWSEEAAARWLRVAHGRTLDLGR
jgi:hypothetical protein